MEAFHLFNTHYSRLYLLPRVNCFQLRDRDKKGIIGILGRRGGRKKGMGGRKEGEEAAFQQKAAVKRRGRGWRQMRTGWMEERRSFIKTYANAGLKPFAIIKRSFSLSLSLLELARSLYCSSLMHISVRVSPPFIFSRSPLHRLLIPSYRHQALPFAPALDPFPPIENKVDTLEIVSFSLSRPEATLPTISPHYNPFSTTVPASSAFSPLSCAPFSPITLSLTFILVARPGSFLPSRLRPLQREKRGSPGLWGNRFHPLRPFLPPSPGLPGMHVHNRTFIHWRRYFRRLKSRESDSRVSNSL